MRMIEDKRDVVPEILAFTFIQFCAHPHQTRGIN